MDVNQHDDDDDEEDYYGSTLKELCLEMNLFFLRKKQS